MIETGQKHINKITIILSLLTGETMPLWGSFVNGIDRVIKELKVRPVEKFGRLETSGVGIDYYAWLEGKDTTIFFSISTTVNKNDPKNIEKWQEIKYLFVVYNDFGLVQFDKFTRFGGEHFLNVESWLIQVIRDLQAKRKRQKLDFMFGDRPIKILGDWGVSNSSAQLFEVVLKGCVACKPDRILIYKMRHVPNDSFSYALFTVSRYGIYDYSVWVCFPYFCGLRGGTSYGAYQFVENIIKETNKAIPIKVVEFDVAVKDWLDWLLKQQERYKLISSFGEPVEPPLEQSQRRRGDEVHVPLNESNLDFNYYGQIVAEKLKTIDIFEKAIKQEGTDELVLQRILERAPWLINPRWELTVANRSLKTFQEAFESWYKKEYKKEITTTTRVEHGTKRPDFIFLNREDSLIIVEIKPPKHEFNDEDWERLQRYYDAMEGFFEKNTRFNSLFPKGTRVILVRDSERLTSATVKKAYTGLVKEKRIEPYTWAELLENTKRDHEGFLIARDKFDED